MQLTEEQNKALSAIRRFLTKESPEVPSVFILKGYAGTGKTMLLSEVTAIAASMARTVYLCAPTGRAARILSSKTGHTASTLHRLIYSPECEKQISFTKNQETANFHLRTNDSPSDALYIIDEASMVSDRFSHTESLRFGSGKLLTDLIDFLQLKDTSRKVLFCGDPAQLPPVGMSGSPALCKSYLQQHFTLQSTALTLTQIHRQQQSNSIIETAIKVRSQLSRPFIEELTIAADGRQLREAPLYKIFERYARELKQKTIPSTTWLCATNRDALRINQQLRSYLGFSNDHIEEGELLMVVRNHYNGDHLLLNGDMLRVTGVSKRNEHFETTYTPPGKRKQLITLAFRDIQVHLLHQPDQVFVVKVLVTSLMQHDHRHIHAAMLAFARHRYKASGTKLSFNHYRQQDPYLQTVWLRYGYAITCHKAQGGEWKHIIADFGYLAAAGRRYFLHRAYTALTRAIESVTVINPVYIGNFRNILVHQIQFLPFERKIAGELITDTTIEDTDPEIWHRFPFLKQAEQTLQQAGQNKGYSLTFEHRPGAVRMYLKNRNGETDGMADLFYNPKGYIPQISACGKVCSKAEALIAHLQDALRNPDSLITPPARPAKLFKAVFMDYMYLQCEAAGVQILDFIEEPWVDIYILKTDRTGAEIHCFYTGEDRYTDIEPHSWIGAQDYRLQKLVDGLMGVREPLHPLPITDSVAAT